MSADQPHPAAAAGDPEAPPLSGVVASVSCNDVSSFSKNDVSSFSKPVRTEITLIAGLGVAGDVHAGVRARHRGRVAADPTQPNLRQVHLIPAELQAEVRLAGYDVPPGGLGENITTSGLDLLGLPCGTLLRFGRKPTAVDAGDSAAGDAGGGEIQARGGAEITADVGAGPEAVVAVAAAATLDGPATVAVAALVARVEADVAAGRGADPRPAVVVTGLRDPCQQINGFRPGLLKQVLGRDADGNLVRRAGIMGVVLRGGSVRPGDPIEAESPAQPHLPLDRV